MKLTPITIATALLLATGLLSQQTSAMASSEGLSLQQLNSIARDLTPSPDFFQEGREMFEQEIQRLIETQKASPEPPLDITFDPQAEIDRQPQIQPSDFPSESQ